MFILSVVVFLAYCLYERHKYFNKYKLKRETKAQYRADKEDAELNAIADSRKGQKRISVNIEDL